MGGDEAMHPARHPDTRLTYEDFLLFPDDGRRHELIDGEHYVSAAPNTRHQRISHRLVLALGTYVVSHPGVGEVFAAPFDVVISDSDVVEPDLMFVAADQPDIVTEQHVRGAPALVIELMSAGTRRVDEKIKYGLFERAGVREYWVVDPELDLVKVFRRAPDGRLARLAELTADAAHTLTTPLLAGLELPLADLLR